MIKGVVRRLVRERYAGIIKTERGEEVLFSGGQLQGMSYDSRLEGQQVEFEVRRGADGRPEAFRIRRARAGG